MSLVKLTCLYLVSCILYPKSREKFWDSWNRNQISRSRHRSTARFCKRCTGHESRRNSGLLQPLLESKKKKFIHGPADRQFCQFISGKINTTIRSNWREILFQYWHNNKWIISVLLTYLITYLLTYMPTHSTDHGPSWQSNRFLVSQEILHILRNPKLH